MSTKAQLKLKFEGKEYNITYDFSKWVDKGSVEYVFEEGDYSCD